VLERKRTVKATLSSAPDVTEWNLLENTSEYTELIIATEEDQSLKLAPKVLATSFSYPRHMRAGGQSSPSPFHLPMTVCGQCTHHS